MGVAAGVAVEEGERVGVRVGAGLEVGVAVVSRFFASALETKTSRINEAAIKSLVNPRLRPKLSILLHSATVTSVHSHSLAGKGSRSRRRTGSGPIMVAPLPGGSAAGKRQKGKKAPN